MAIMKLVDSILTEIEFSPLRDGYESPDESNRMIKVAIDGTVHIIKPYKKGYYRIPLNTVDPSDAAQLITWWEDLEELSFYPDLINDAGTYITALIINTESPLHKQFQNPNYYEGTLEIKEK